jgi:23S rRNA (cytosine1962-C5)-methyltransferase
VPAIILNPGREKSILRRHPWIFSGAVQRVEGDPMLGATVDVLSAAGEFLAQASFSPHSQIRGRIWTFDHQEIGKEFFREKMKSSLQARNILSIEADTNALRLVHAESDGLPGLIVDRYDEVLILQSLTAGSEFWKETLADLLLEATGLRTIYERSDADVRELEGLPRIVGPLRGPAPASRLAIQESGLKFIVDIEHGHKTGFYLDQRNNREQVRQLARGRDVLNCFCYTGGFGVYAMAGGAKAVVSVDTSADALAIGRENYALNGLTSGGSEWIEADVFQMLRKFRDQDRSFDMIILDPPKFASTSARVEKAARAYKDINLLAFKLLRPGGILVTFSCSGGVDAALFQKIVASAALDAGVDALIMEHLSQGPDHPIALNFPEGSYLKGLVCLKK